MTTLQNKKHNDNDEHSYNDFEDNEYRNLKLSR